MRPCPGARSRVSLIRPLPMCCACDRLALFSDGTAPAWHDGQQWQCDERITAAAPSAARAQYQSESLNALSSRGGHSAVSPAFAPGAFSSRTSCVSKEPHTGRPQQYGTTST